MKITNRQVSWNVRFGNIENVWTSDESSTYENFTLLNCAWYHGAILQNGNYYIMKIGFMSSDNDCIETDFTINREGTDIPSSLPQTVTVKLSSWGISGTTVYGYNIGTATQDYIESFYNLDGTVNETLLPTLNAYIFSSDAKALRYISITDTEEKDLYAKENALNYSQIQVNINPLNTIFSVYRSSNWKPKTTIKWKSEKIGATNSKYLEEECVVIIRAYNSSLTFGWNPKLPTDDSEELDGVTKWVIYSGGFSEKKFSIGMLDFENYNSNWWVKPLELPCATVFEMWVKANDGAESRHAWAYFTNDNKIHLVTSPYKVALTNWKAGYFHSSSEDTTTAKIVDGDGESDDDYIDPTDNIIDPTDPSPYSSIGFLNVSYALTRERCKSFSNYIWTAGVFDNIKLMNQSPIENIVSCKIFPMTFTGTDETIKLGNVDTTTGARIGDTSTFLYDLGTVTVKPYYNSFLDYSPYTTLSIFLPFVGFRELDSKLLVGKSLNVKYSIDIVCGTCKALLYVSGVELYSFDGNIGIDIPIASGTRAQIEKALISGAVSSVGSAIAENPVGVVSSLVNTATSSLHNQSTGSHSSATSAYETLTCYLIYDRPVWQNIEGFNHAYGRFCGLTKNLASLDGFTICNENVELSGIVCSNEEKEEIKNYLTSGVFL